MRRANGDSITETERSTTMTNSESESETDEDLAPSLDSSPYIEGERVLVSHNKRIYNAKGWNKNWDEWVAIDRLMKHNDENVQKQKAINAKQDADKNLNRGRAVHIRPKSSNAARGRKRKNDSLCKEKGAICSEKFVNLQLPLILKKQLVDDCEFITQLGKLVKLPRSPNVDGILKKYLEYRSKKDGMVADSVREILKGLRCYFNKALPVLLLYKTEHQQYEEMIADDVSPATVYGAEHLLRLFVKLPELLSLISIEEETMIELQLKLVDFLKFLQKNQNAFFLTTYLTA
ncbi:protein MRG1-like isoform X2 [Carica papaya]|uniref:protein MRG1-like isoform X2 n=1 Tax=Carica papaya TaxID=3649 RepID=UPI000B8C99BC|nr:protein MRG1-like isoform X2 [Carica papaya]